MSQASYIPDMMGDPRPDVPTGPSQIASFYAGRNILLTGGTGFLGTLLTERILRSFPDVNSLFLLVRTKKGKSPEERFKELFEDVIFDRLRRKSPAFHDKVVLIEGDMTEAGLGLSSAQRELLRSTEIVIHGAATVRFDEKLRVAASINVRGTEELLLLAKEMTDLKAFVYISTAYANCTFNEIEERFYEPPIDSVKLLSLLEILDDASLEHLTPVLVGQWPNTYAFTKSVIEDTIRRNAQLGLPLCIVRPSIVTATCEEPIAGWTNNLHGFTGCMLSYVMGILRTLYCHEDLVADLIPADFVVNNIIVAAWDLAEAQSKNAKSANNSTVPAMQKDPLIYNAVSSCQRPITWGQLLKFGKKHWAEIPSELMLWYCVVRLNSNRLVHQVFVLFLHLLPAAIVDSLAWLTGRKPTLWALYKKVHKFCSIIEYFCEREWKFHDDNVLQLWKKLSPTDRSQFNFDVRSIDWDNYSYNHVRGLRVFLLKDPMDTLPRGLAHYARLKVAHYTLVTVFCGIVLWLLCKCLRCLDFWSF